MPVRTAEIAAAPAPDEVTARIAAPNNGPAAPPTAPKAPPTLVHNDPLLVGCSHYAGEAGKGLEVRDAPSTSDDESEKLASLRSAIQRGVDDINRGNSDFVSSPTAWVDPLAMTKARHKAE